jgi:trk system potassium uptake protein
VFVLSVRYSLYVIGALLLVLASSMLIPAAVDGVNGDPDWMVFAISSFTTAFSGAVLLMGFRQEGVRFGLRTGYLITVGSWVFIGAFGSLPLMLSSLKIGVTDAIFETMSALTTTGSTVLVGLDTMPKGILLWRSIMQWIGGIGIVAMAIILLPMLRVGGMQLFLTESSTIADKGTPRLVRFATAIAAAYVGLTVLCAVALMAAGMGSFDAVNHAMTTIATGGFSTKDASVGHFDSVPVETVLIIFMAASALPLVLYAHLFMKGWSAFRADAQIPAFLAILCGAIGTLTLWLWAVNGMPFTAALRVTAFNVTSVLTDTGFGSADFSQWGSLPVGVLFGLLLVGGCAGSTSGAIKIFRWQILWIGIHQHLEHVLMPHKVLVARYSGRSVSAEMMGSVRNFFFLYLLTLTAISLGVMATGMDFLAASSAVAQAMANAGPGLTQDIGPAGNFASVPEAGKWLLILAMLLGRLELVTVYVLFLRSYWFD